MPQVKCITSKALRCGSHSFYNASTPTLPSPVTFPQAVDFDIFGIFVTADVVDNRVTTEIVGKGHTAWFRCRFKGISPSDAVSVCNRNRNNKFVSRTVTKSLMHESIE